ncbi:hypothetical protein EJB05_19005 [Eragrostis curvula]|uniref:WRKY domain-containing protein n=1 Tax=Eragrostis curvula TaxID=38414 RepID=A0A5J9VMN1_9POAL|nr:hypothetical protein EJB05_19005 [Eragrostis curvula]
MEELDGSAAVLEMSNKYWHQDFGEELLMSELLDNTSAAAPPPVSKGDDDDGEGPRRRRESMVNKLISTVYSGPTISDIESALSFTGGDHHQLAVDARKYNSSSPVVFSPEKVLSKMENKYTLKIKTCGNGLAEDGYKWRKYGQKSIKNSPNPRSYYRCTNPRCNAKKQVERATDEPDTLVVTYEGLHLHYTYSHFLHAAQQQGPPGLPKKPKRSPMVSDSSPSSVPDLDGPAHAEEVVPPPAAAAAASPAAAANAMVPASCNSSAATCYYFDEEEVFQQAGLIMNQHEEEEEEEELHMASNGLLEDVVPLLVRQPCGGSTTSSSSPPPGSSPSTSSICWTPTSPYIDMAILSNIF